MLIDKEFQEDMKGFASENDEHILKISELLKNSSISQRDRKAIEMEISMLRQHIASNIPFIKEQFTRQMNAVVVEAKNEIEAFVDAKIRSTGLEGMKKELKQLGTDSTLALTVEDEK